MFWAVLSLVPKKHRRDLRTLARVTRRLQTADADERQALLENWRLQRKKSASRLYAGKRDSDDTRLVKQLAHLKITHQLDASQLDALFEAYAAESDELYVSVNQTMRWLYGSAESLGSLSAGVLGLNKSSARVAPLLGRALGYLEMLVLLDANVRRGQHHFSAQELRRFGLSGLDDVTAHAESDAFKTFMHAELRLVGKWQREAERQLGHLPKNLRPAVRLLLDILRWQLHKLRKNPLMIYAHPPIPSKTRLRIMKLTRRFD